MKMKLFISPEGCLILIRSKVRRKVIKYYFAICETCAAQVLSEIAKITVTIKISYECETVFQFDALSIKKKNVLSPCRVDWRW